MHPYATPDPRHHRSDSDSENTDPSGSQSVDQRPPRLFSLTRHSSLDSNTSTYNQFSDHGYPLSRMPTLTSVVNIDKMANDARLDTMQRRAVHSFAKLDTDDRMTTLFVHTLQNEAKLNTLLTALTDTDKTLSTLRTFMNETWNMTDNQEKLLKGLLRHYLIMPLSSYQNIAGHVQSYILKHLASLHLDLYKTDPTVKETVNGFLSAQINNIKSSFRKIVFASVTKKTGLNSFARKTIETYHLPAVPDNPPQDVLATFALMRAIADPLIITVADPGRPRGGDTGFWTKVEDKLEELYSDYGDDRKSPNWLEWETKVIAADKARYACGNAADQAHTRTELDLALEPVAPGSAEGSSSHSWHHSEGLAVRDICIADLGDMAADITTT
ncbi:hypothetical protein C8R44DRAFT_742721 [Mycena epipterygia]|nr:hypothetical protein C8R44DRAFT_742721 [Mycena epipterygia]